MSLCVCGSGKEDKACCLPLHAGAPAPTAEALMRARYAAYVLGNIDYVERTNAPEAAKEFDRKDAESFSRDTEWQGLDVLRTEAGGPQDQRGIVEFIFRCQQQGKPYMQRELASFYRGAEGQWLYEDSQINPKGEPVHVEKVGRNDPCPCGSGKKYKKCCGAAA